MRSEEWWWKRRVAAFHFIFGNVRFEGCEGGSACGCVPSCILSPAGAAHPPQNGFLANRCAVARNDMLAIGFFSGAVMPFGGGSLFSGAIMQRFAAPPPGVILSRAAERGPSAKDLFCCSTTNRQGTQRAGQAKEPPPAPPCRGGTPVKR